MAPLDDRLEADIAEAMSLVDSRLDDPWQETTSPALT
jgi:hypothetical protein